MVGGGGRVVRVVSMSLAISDGLLQALDDVDVGLGVVEVPCFGSGGLSLLDFGGLPGAFQEWAAFIFLFSCILFEVPSILLVFGVALWKSDTLIILSVRPNHIFVL